MADDRRHRVLVVDDNPATRYSTGRVLRAANFDVAEAATGTEAIVRARQTPDLVILDVNLPDVDGFEVCRRLRSQPDTARTPVIHLSATFVKDDDKVHGLQAGADGYLTHPVEPPVLIATVNAFLRAREAEEAMRASEARFKAVFDNAVNGIALLTDGLIYLEANPAMAATLGLDREEILGKHVSAFLPSGSEEILLDVDSSLRSTGVWRGTFPVLHANGRPVELEWSVSIHSEPSTRLAVTTDISERRVIEAERERLLASERLARAEAERANRLKDDFLAAISHELRTPLNAILGWAHVMELQKPPAAMTPGLEAINRNVRVLAQMIADLLDVSRITTGKLRLELQAFDLEPALDALIAGFAPAAAAKSIQITSHVDPAAGRLVWDLARFQQVVSNLLDNAIKFSATNGRIELEARATAHDVTIAIRDEGRGIAREFLPHVFDRFRQEDAGTTRRYGGLGLGLAIVKQLVEAHGGSISVDSGGEGAGATFTVRMPRLPLPRLDADTGSPLEHHSLDGVRVLVLDDDDDARELAVRILSEFGATVQPSSSVREAKLLLETFRPDLIFSDISMPDEDGYEFIRFLRSPDSPATNVPAVALTAFGSDSDRAQLLGSGYQLHLAKPFEPLKLVESAVDLIGPSAGTAHVGIMRHECGGDHIARDRSTDRMSPKDPLDERPDEKARREQSPDEAVEESEAIVENERKQGTDLPPLKEPYGGKPDERTRRV